MIDILSQCGFEDIQVTAASDIHRVLSQEASGK